MISFIDAGVLIDAVRGSPDDIVRIKEFLDNPKASFASSSYVRLEVLPKASFYRRNEERQFYIDFFESVRHWAPVGESLVQEALEVAVKFGLSALDALHVAAALAVGADELITSENPSKPIHRVREIAVRTI
ncbi:MAG TPA: PIN domain-containing protein [Thermoanaerobaculia bacterium]|jgi:hypothetical protein|nr:PIN domain-containing protein [Thermoanaerobaculia bacterium]